MYRYEELAEAADKRIVQEKRFTNAGIKGIKLFLSNIVNLLNIPSDFVNDRELGHINRLTIKEESIRVDSNGVHCVLICFFGNTKVSQEITCLPLEEEMFSFCMKDSTASASLSELENNNATEAVEMFSHVMFKRFTSGVFRD